MHPFELEGQGYQGPLPGHGGEAPAHELPEAHGLLDDAKDGFNGTVAFRVRGATLLGLQPPRHLHQWIVTVGGGGVGAEALLQWPVVRLAAKGAVDLAQRPVGL